MCRCFTVDPPIRALCVADLTFTRSSVSCVLLQATEAMGENEQAAGSPTQLEGATQAVASRGHNIDYSTERAAAPAPSPAKTTDASRVCLCLSS